MNTEDLDTRATTTASACNDHDDDGGGDPDTPFPDQLPEPPEAFR